MTVCKCSERQRTMKFDLPIGSNERPRQWFVITRNSRLMRSSGPFGNYWSAYSTIECRVCGAYWKTKADFVRSLENCEYFPHRNSPKVEPIESQQR